jgi:hypothetical protein
MCKRMIIFLGCVLAAGLTVQAGTFTIVDLPATGTDAAIGISTSKTYTHTFDFGANAPVTINGVVFERGPTASLTALYTGTSRQGYGYTLSETRATMNLPVHAGNDPSAQADGDSAELLRDMVYQGTPNPGDAERLTLSNLVAGTTYSTRFYYRTWTLPSDPSRVINISADGETHGTLSDTFRLSEDAGGSHYLDYTFTADSTDVTFQFAATVYNYSFHIYGLTNEVIRVAGCATFPVPANEASDVLRDTLLAWSPGTFAATHDVYLGTVFEDVNNASRTNPLRALISQGQDANTCDPGRLEFGKTWYWRVDEVNAVPDSTIYKGFVWSFRVEPQSYAVTNIKATASGSNTADSGPEKTIDGSGLNAADQHSVNAKDMWLSKGKPAWIQYEFDRVQKLDRMLVWNYNEVSEIIIGFGARNVTVEYSTDANDWTTLGDFEFTKATGDPTYAGGVPVDFGGAVAKYVKLTIQDNWGNLVPQCGLSEVRFLAVPMRARQPQPASDATGVAPLITLSWRYGREAATHEVYLGTDPNDLALIATVAEPSCEVSVDLEETYFWKVIEVNEAETPSVWESDTWSFSTRPYLVVDDFESYNDEEDQGTRIYETWIDGWDDPAVNGAVVGYGDPPFAEQARVHGGLQSMPLTYDNATQAPYSLAERTFGEPQDWTQHNIQSLSLYFSGASTNEAGQLYLRINNGAKLFYQGAADDFKQPAWAPFNVDLAAAGTNLASVTKLTVGIDDAGVTGKLLIDDIRLYPKAVELMTPVTPATTGLLAHYKLDGDGQDAAGSHHGTLTNLPTFVPGLYGQALSVTLDQYVNVPYTADLSLHTFTVAVWINPSDLGGNRGILGTRFNGDNTFDVKVSAGLIHGDIGNGTVWLSTAVDVAAALSVDEWYHLAYVFDDAADTAEIYVNGIRVRTMVVTGTPLFMKAGQDLRIGVDYPNETFRGLIDDVRIYSRPLSMAEVAGLAARTAPVYQPF